MINIGDIYYIIPGTIDSSLNGCPVIIYAKVDGYWRGRYVRSGYLVHDWFNFDEKTIWRYLEKR